MAKLVVEVMPKQEILDPQGRAVQKALARQGLAGVADVRQGKRFEITIDGDLDLTDMERLTELSGELLSNPVIEECVVHIVDEGGVER